MKILLLGGTGAMGVHLKDILASRGDDVFITSRRRRSDEQHIHYIQGNAHDIVFLHFVLKQGWDAIVDFMVYSTDEFKQRVPLLLSATHQYIFISSSRVYAESEKPITETSPRLLDVLDDAVYLATDEYALRKARQEDLLLKGTAQNFTIVRPYITYSEERLQLGDMELHKWLLRALDGRTIVLSRDIADHYTTLTYGLDVANGINSLIGNEKALGETFHITGTKAMTWREVLGVYLDTIQDITGIRPKVKWIERSRILSNPAQKYQVLYDRFFDRQFDNSKILSIAPWLEFTDPSKGLPSCVKHYAKTQDLHNYSVIDEAENDRVTHEHLRLSQIRSFKHKILYIVCRYFHVKPNILVS